MDLLSLVLACSPLVDPATALRVIAVESGGHPFAIHDNTDGRAYDAGNVTDTVKVAAGLIRARHSVDLGLMQINYQAWLKPTGFSLEWAFDPCTNVRLGTTILSANFGQALMRTRSPREAWWRSLSRYNSGNESSGWAYAHKVLNAGARSRAPRRSSIP